MTLKFNYPDLNSESVEGLRIYSVPSSIAVDGVERHYPSITTILGNTQPEEKRAALEAWAESIGKEKAALISKEATDKGTAVHLLIERFLKGEQLVHAHENFPPHYITCFNSLTLKLKKIDEIWGQEVALYSDLLGVAGRCDAIGVYKGKESIIDFKTSSRIKSEAEITDYYLQLTAYSIMHNEMFDTEISNGVILMTSGEGGFPQEFQVDLTEWVDPLVKRVDQFYSQLQI